ncbi:xanthine/uracil permease [Balneicella halophila]|uniref:Xanthine/uracil permease n=1 Tax=Balneicella halophila TaxID=1537566 RepID=A0A7L4UPI1_BALHA|nr:solute carrier family 23 protein [Balneicella halophila]PVX51018.1 xanthine/uracil permease [Balneicella halophila]
MSKLRYDIDEKLPSLPMILYGLQWFLVTIPSILIVGAIVAQFHYESIADQIFYTQRLLGIVGFALVVQILWGHRLPIVIGPASVLLIGILSSQADKISEIYTAILIGGVLVFLTSYIKPILNRIPLIFTSRIVIVILALIAFTLMPTIIDLVFSGGLAPLGALSFGLIGLFILILLNKFLQGIWKSTVVLWGLIFGALAYYFVLGIPVDNTVNKGEVSSSWTVFPLRFDIGIILSFIFCYLALFINELGSIQGVAKAIDAKSVDESTESGLRVTGLANALSGIFGVIGTVDFSFSPGVIMSTGCASRYALLPAGIALILIAFFPPLIEIFLLIPNPVMGFVFLFLMTSQLGAALQMIPTNKAVKSFEQSLIIAIPLLIAIFIAFLPKEIQNAIPTILKPILSNAFVMGVIVVLLSEHFIFKKKKNKEV